MKPVELEQALEQQKRLAEVIDTSRLVVKTAALEEAIEEWTPSELRRVQSMHSAIILASESGLSMSRTTPMPPSQEKNTPSAQRELLRTGSQHTFAATRYASF